MEESTLTKGQLVYWVRKSTESVESVRVHSITDEYFTCLELRGQRTYLFSNKCLDDTVFVDPVEADERLSVLQDVWKSQRHEPAKGSLSYVLRGVKESDED